MDSRSQSKAVVLLSSGLDSTYNLFKAQRDHRVVLALTFDYGQRAARQEIAASARLASQLGIPHQVIALPWFRDFTHSALVTGTGIPQGPEVEVENLERSRETAKSVWVPNRNGILLSIAAGFAEGLGAQYVIPGFNKEEARTFPDNTHAFLNALEVCWEFSTANHVKGLCFSIGKTKAEIVADGIGLGLPFARLWPCYMDGENWCGRCESCQRFMRALAENGLSFEHLRAGQ
jgi:7-cyano-7-deazaguanine synthase